MIPYRICLLHDMLRKPYAWPGGYPTFLLMEDGGTLCHKCTKAHHAEIYRAARDPDTDHQWQPEGREINWEDAMLTCSHCGERIESAYADED